MPPAEPRKPTPSAAPSKARPGTVGAPDAGGRTGQGPGGYGGDTGFVDTPSPAMPPADAPSPEAAEPGQHGGPAGQQRGGGSRQD